MIQQRAVWSHTRCARDGTCGAVQSVRAVYGSWFFSKVQVQASFVSDVVKGDQTTQILVTLIKYLEDEVPVGDD